MVAEVVEVAEASARGSAVNEGAEAESRRRRMAVPISKVVSVAAVRLRPKPA